MSWQCEGRGKEGGCPGCSDCQTAEEILGTWCDACNKRVEIVTGRECGLEKDDTRFDDYVAVTGSLPCSKEVAAEAGRILRKTGGDR